MVCWLAGRSVGWLVGRCVGVCNCLFVFGLCCAGVGGGVVCCIACVFACGLVGLAGCVVLCVGLLCVIV